MNIKICNKEAYTTIEIHFVSCINDSSCDSPNRSIDIHDNDQAFIKPRPYSYP